MDAPAAKRVTVDQRMMARGFVPGIVGTLLLCAGSAGAQERYALIVSGASGGAEYAAQYHRWSDDLATSLVERFKLPRGAVTMLSDSPQPDVAATAANVRRLVELLAGRIAPQDLLLVVLIGHGTFDGIDAKFNLVGPDLESADWAALLKPVRGQVVIVNTTSASFPFLERLAGPRRIIITATDSTAQKFDTVFPNYFIGALGDDAADLDKNQRTSIWEAFASASSGVLRHYQERGLLATERALMDDNGDGTGVDAMKSGEVGSYASRTYLDEAAPDAAPTDEVLLRLLHRRALLTLEADDLRIRRGFLAPDDYAAEFERLMVELALVSRDIRRRAGS